jgi:hypothetical protein
MRVWDMEINIDSKDNCIQVNHYINLETFKLAGT